MRCTPLFAQILNLPTNAGLEGVRGRESANSQAPIRNAPTRNPRKPLLLERGRPTHKTSLRALET
eukprot:9306766-Alexandrium_andersonii.AAC.1